MTIKIKASHKGRLHQDLGIPAGQPIPASALKKAEHSLSARIRKEAGFAANAKHWNKK